MIYIVYSPENEILELEVAKLINNVDVLTFDYEEVDHQVLINEVMAIDLFVEQKTFIINNPKFLTTKSASLKPDVLNSMFVSFNTTLHDIIFCIQKPILKEVSHLHESLFTYMPFEIELQDWSKNQITTFIAHEGIKINQTDLEKLCANLNEDYFLITNELQRLSLVNAEHKITTDIINEYSFSVLEADVFMFIDCVMHNRKKQARILYDQLINEGSNPVSLLEMFATQVRFYYQVQLLSKSYKPKEIATLLKANPYRVTKTFESLKKISHILLINKYKKTAELEYLSKAGKINPDIVFDLLI